MAWQSEVSSCGDCKISYDTTNNLVKITDITNSVSWTTPIGADGTEYVSNNIVPGFGAGKWMIKIGQLIKEALT